ncbi:MAG: DUF3857 domain-containing protein [Chitinophagaceae bacterium]
MNFQKLAFALSFFCTTSLSAQTEYRVSDIPKNLLANASLIVRKEEKTIEMRSMTDVRIHTFQVLTVMNEKDNDMVQLVIGYAKNRKIDHVKGFVYDADGNLVRKFGVKDMVDESAVHSFSLYEDSRVKYFEPNAVNYPITVVYDYTVNLSQNLIIPDRIPKYRRDVAIQESSFSFICNNGDSILLKEANLPTAHTESVSPKGQKSYSWVVSNIPAEREEPLSPPYYKDRICVKIAPTQFYYYKYKGSYHDWTELGKWFYNSLLKDQQTPTPRMVELVKQTIETQKTQKEIVSTLYQYLQKNIRYVSVQIGIGGFCPMSAAEVDAKGYGDCKALVNYMQTLLNTAKIPSYYCVVEAGSQKEDMDASYASLDQGNHVVLMVPMAKDTLWLECTSNDMPAGLLGDFTDDRLVWASNADNSFIVRTPVYTADQNRQVQRADMVMDGDGNLKGRFEAAFSGVQYDNHLEYVNLSSYDKEKKLIQTYNIDNMQISNVLYRTEAASGPTLYESFAVELPHCAAKNGNMYYLKPNLFNHTSVPPTVRNRKLPFFFSRGYVDEDSLTVQLPANIHLENGSLDKAVTSIFGTYQVVVKEENGFLKYYRRIQRNEGQFDADKYEDYIDFISGLDNLDARKIMLAEK